MTRKPGRVASRWGSLETAGSCSGGCSLVMETVAGAAEVVTPLPRQLQRGRDGDSAMETSGGTETTMDDAPHGRRPPPSAAARSRRFWHGVSSMGEPYFREAPRCTTSTLSVTGHRTPLTSPDRPQL